MSTEIKTLDGWCEFSDRTGKISKVAFRKDTDTTSFWKPVRVVPSMISVQESRFVKYLILGSIHWNFMKYPKVRKPMNLKRSIKKEPASKGKMRSSNDSMDLAGREATVWFRCPNRRNWQPLP